MVNRGHYLCFILIQGFSYIRQSINRDCISESPIDLISRETFQNVKLHFVTSRSCTNLQTHHNIVENHLYMYEDDYQR